MKKKITKNDIIYILSLIGFFAIFSTTISKNPVLSLYAKNLGATEAIIGLIAAFSPLAGILFSFPVGMLSDRIGRKRLLVVSGIVYAIAPLLYLLVKDPMWLIPIRFFHGLSNAILGPVVAAMIVDRYGDNKGEMLGIYSSSTLIGRTIAPLVGGFIISIFAMYPEHMNYRLVYVAAFFAALPVLALIFFIKENKAKTKIKKTKIRDFFSSLAYFVSERRLFTAALIEMATYFSFGALETYLPLYLQSKGVAPYLIGLIFSVQILAIALSKPIFGKMSDTADRRKQIVGGIAIIGITMALFTLFSNIVIITIIGVVFGLGLSFSTVATSTYVAHITKKNQLGASLGALSSIMDIGHSTGPLIAGIVITSLGYTFGFMTCFLVSAATCVMFILGNYGKEAEIN